MSKPEYVYMLSFENHSWIYCYYDVDKARDKGIEFTMIRNPEYELDGFYYDDDGEDLHLFHRSQEIADPDGIEDLATICSYIVEDYDE